MPKFLKEIIKGNPQKLRKIVAWRGRERRGEEGRKRTSVRGPSECDAETE